MELSSKSAQRMESKKRKVQAFLELVSKDTGYLNYREKRFKDGSYDTEEDSSCSLASMRAKVREYKKYKGPPPSFELLDPGIQAQINFSSDTENQQPTVPLYTGDIQQLLLKAVLNQGSPCRPRWCSLHQSHLVSKVLLVIIEGLSKDVALENLPVFCNLTDGFHSMVEMITPYKYSATFAAELCELSLIFAYEVVPNAGINTWNILPCNSHKALESIVPVTAVQGNNRDPDEGFSRLHLLLSPIQMLMEGFPLPHSVCKSSNTKGYEMTKDVYCPVTSKSPIFALDCEMCRVSSGRMAVTRIAVVDEGLKTVYCTLVKPSEKIIDYVTKYSGVTADMLKSVTTRLGDVQNKIKELLPQDAILCGQSLNFDLHALRIIHPYVIDTSVIYNTSGCRTRKTALKVLSSTFLKEKIQNNETGHNPVEDCIATMKLVQLKLKNGPFFGDAILSSKLIVKTEPEENAERCSEDSSIQKSCNTFGTSFFSQFTHEKKNCLIAVNDVYNELYPEKMFNQAVTKEALSSNKKVLNHTLQEMSKYNFTISHFGLPSSGDTSKSVTKINKWIGKLYEACPAESMFILVGTGFKKAEGNYENGFCQVKIKNE